MSSSYVTIRDDTGQRSLSVNERDFLRSCALNSVAECEDDVDDSDGDNDNQNSSKVLRCDGRRGNDVRNVRMQLGRWDNGAECTVQWGAGTRVTSLISSELVPPSSDRSNEGIMNFTVDISPMAGSTFKLAPAISTGPASGSSSMRGSNHSDQYQRLLSNRILRCIERIVLIGGAIDTEALVLQAGKWVWKITVALTVLDAGGNILDACVLAAMAVLKHYRKPQVDLSDGGDGSAVDTNTASLPTMIPSIVKEATPLPLHHTPLSISFGLIPADDAVNSTSSTSIVAALIDPTDREELVQSGSLTIAMNIHSEICLLDYGGGCELTPNKLRQCWKVAETAIKNLCQLLETALTKADEQAQKERLQRLQLKQQSGNINLPPPPPSKRNIPFLQQTENGNEMEIDADIDEAQVQQVHTEAEEAYRQQALDYSSGHVATAVREDDDANHGGGQNFGRQAGSLLADMLKSVGQTPKTSTGAKETFNEDKITDDLVKEDKKSKAIEDAKYSSSKDTATSSSRKPTAINLDDDDDEEEEAMILDNEFSSIKKDDSEANKIEETMDTKVDEEEEEEADIEDLSMAIKSKKSKKKKKPKKK
ncbi:MAG: exosome complex component RRP45 [Bacillariaceae sp.]|jgi:exosome complex component RRP45